MFVHLFDSICIDKFRNLILLNNGSKEFHFTNLKLELWNNLFSELKSILYYQRFSYSNLFQRLISELFHCSVMKFKAYVACSRIFFHCLHIDSFLFVIFFVRGDVQKVLIVA